MTEYKKLDNYSNYRIYPDGRVYSEVCNRFLKGCIDGHGYPQYGLINDDTKPKKVNIHRLIAVLFIPNPDNKEMVDHIDRDRQNNSIENLRWVSRGQNRINSGVSGNIPYKHICYGNKKHNILQVKINRNNKNIFRKTFATKKYTLEDVVKIRNEQYKIHGIEIDDA